MSKLQIIELQGQVERRDARISELEKQPTYEDAINDILSSFSFQWNSDDRITVEQAVDLISQNLKTG